MQGERAEADDRSGGRRGELPWPDAAPIFASGTDAVAALLRWGAAEHGWARAWLPSYYCPEVPAGLRAFAPGIELLAYPDHDLSSPADLSAAAVLAGDVVVVANQLGLRPAPGPARFERAGVVLVDDHSHDLLSGWACGSTADYAIASLRKTLPIPDGGVVWSPRSLDLPPEPPTTVPGTRPARLANAIDRRGRGEAGSASSDDEFIRLRALARTAEASWRASASARASTSPGAPDRPGISPVSRALVAQMPVRAWRERRRTNVDTLTRAIGTTPNAQILAAPDGGVAFAFTLLFDTAAERARVRDALAARAVVSTILWPLDPTHDPGTTQADADVSSRILSVHADQRFGEADMLVLAGILREVLGSG